MVSKSGGQGEVAALLDVILTAIMFEQKRKKHSPYQWTEERRVSKESDKEAKSDCVLEDET